MLSAALEARYAYQPPRRLSLILPTRADNAANTDRDCLRIFGEKCFDLDGVEATETAEAFERWSRHVLLATPALPAHEKAGDEEVRNEIS